MKKILLVTLLMLAIGFQTFVLAETNNKPLLEDGILMYTIQGNSYDYEFKVKYVDADGNMPKYVFVYINGSKRVMEKVNELDIDPSDGLEYRYNITEDELNSIIQKTKDSKLEYWFRTNNGKKVFTTAKLDAMAFDSLKMGFASEVPRNSGCKN